MMRLFVIILCLASAASASSLQPPPEIRGALRAAAAEAQLDAKTILAIEIHETGNYTSRLWRRSHNPGGIHRRPPYSWFGIYASFPTAEDGVRAHGHVLAHPRYDAARHCAEPEHQVAAISKAGYAEGSASWLHNVTSLVRRLAAEGVTL